MISIRALVVVDFLSYVVGAALHTLFFLIAGKF